MTAELRVVSSASVWRRRLTRLSVVGLVAATGYGVFAGAYVTMYYDVAPGMDAREDSLLAIQTMLLLGTTVLGAIHVPALVAAVQRRHWYGAAIAALVVVGPAVVFLGTEGLLAHFVFWSPISDTDRFHLLHHSLTAGVPLTLAYGLALRRWWRPALFADSPPISRRGWFVTGLALIPVVLAVGVFTGMPAALMLMVVLAQAVLTLLWNRRHS